MNNARDRERNLTPAQINRFLDNAIHFSDLIADVSTWPEHYQQLLHKAHKNYDERFRLFLFLWSNGVPPLTCRHWVLYHEQYGYPYDREAHRHLDGMVRDARERPGRLARYPCFDLEMGRVYRHPDPDNL